MEKLSMRETLVKKIQEIGYDTLSACALADVAIEEMKTYPAGTHKMTVGGVLRITFTKKEKPS